MTDKFNYVKERIDDQAEWHSKKADLNKSRFHLVEVTIIIAGALIPIINVFDSLVDYQNILSAVFGTVILIAASMGKLYKYQENWINYRSVEEAIKREKILYTHQIGDYRRGSDERRQRVLVERTEQILESSTSNYLTMHSRTSLSLDEADEE